MGGKSFMGYVDCFEWIVKGLDVVWRILRKLAADA
jgi:hypothetical protein